MTVFAEHSVCYYTFSEHSHMAEFIQKYKNFKIYDENGKVYPLHITRSLNQDLGTENEQLPEADDQI